MSYMYNKITKTKTKTITTYHSFTNNDKIW